MKNLLSICFLCLIIGGASAQETRQVARFHALSVSSSFNVVLQQGSDESVRLDITGIDLDDIRTEVSDGTLKIYKKRGSRNWNNRAQGTIYITYRELDEIHSSGSSDVRCSDPLRARYFELSSSGSGNLYLRDLEAEELRARISGSSDIEVEGGVDRQEISISGSGNYDAAELDCASTSIRISGSGDAAVVARESLKTSVSGSGDVSYWGNPQHVDTHTSGSGDVRKRGSSY